MLQTCKRYFDYLPVILLTLLFATETELEKHAIFFSCQICIVLLTTILFFLLTLKFGSERKTAFAVSFVLWIILMYYKRTYTEKLI
jgi:hypothetical protein